MSSACGSQDSPLPWVGNTGPAAIIPVAQCCQRHSPLLEDSVRRKLRSAGDTAIPSASHHRAFPDILRITLCSSRKTIDGKTASAQTLHCHSWISVVFPVSVLTATTRQELRRTDPFVLDMGHVTRKKAPCHNSPAYLPQQPCKQRNTFGSHVPCSSY